MNKKYRRIIRKHAVLNKTSISDTTLWRLEKAGKFPVKVQITSKIIGYYEDEVDDWISCPTQWKTKKQQR